MTISDEIRSIINEDDREARISRYNKYLESVDESGPDVDFPRLKHKCTFEVAIVGPTRQWYRCKCGEWEKD